MELIGRVSPEVPLVVVAVHLEAEHLATDLPILVTGVGKVAAGQSVLATLAILAPDRRPSALWNMGTAGALRDGVGGTVVCGSVLQHDLDNVAIESLIGEDPGPTLHLGHGPVLATGDRFIADADDRARLAARADLVDMEGYAVAAAGRALELKVALIKHISDRADGDAGEDWVDQVARCSASLGAWLSTNDVPGIVPGAAT